MVYLFHAFYINDFDDSFWTNIYHLSKPITYSSKVTRYQYYIFIYSIVHEDQAMTFYWHWWRTRSTHFTLNPLSFQIDGLVQERRNSSALAMELRLSCTNPSRWCARCKQLDTNTPCIERMKIYWFHYTCFIVCSGGLFPQPLANNNSMCDLHQKYMHSLSTCK